MLKKILLLLVSISFFTSSAFAQGTTNPADNPNLVPLGNNPTTAAAPKPPVIVPPPPSLDAKSYVLMDTDTGQILAEKNMNTRRPPASLTKLMTLYIIFNALDTGQITINDKVRISKTAWRTGGSRMFIVAGSEVPVKDLIQGIIVDSGNDATVAMAEYIAGSQKAFVPIMNQQAKILAMTRTHYDDVNGLPMPDHYSTAHDLALLTRAIIKNYPDQYHWFSQKYFTWDKIKQTNRNWLLFRDPTVDGLKTGHTKEAGYCLISSAKRSNMRLIAVVLGTPTEQARVDESERLLNYGFRFYKTYKIYSANSAVTKARVWGGKNKEVTLGLNKELYLTVPKGLYQNLKIDVQLNNQIHAPVTKGKTYGTLSITLKGKELAQRPIIALQNDPQGGLWTRFSDYISLSAQKFFGGKKKS